MSGPVSIGLPAAYYERLGHVVAWTAEIESIIWATVSALHHRDLLHGEVYAQVSNSAVSVARITAKYYLRDQKLTEVLALLKRADDLFSERNRLAHWPLILKVTGTEKTRGVSNEMRSGDHWTLSFEHYQVAPRTGNQRDAQSIEFLDGLTHQMSELSEELSEMALGLAGRPQD